MQKIIMKSYLFYIFIACLSNLKKISSKTFREIIKKWKNIYNKIKVSEN